MILALADLGRNIRSVAWVRKRYIRPISG